MQGDVIDVPVGTLLFNAMFQSHTKPAHLVLTLNGHTR